MLGRNAKLWMLGIASAAILMSSAAADAQKTNINLAVASNFYGVPPNGAILDLIQAFQALNPNYTVTVVDNGATATLASNIINGNKLGVDLFLAADTETPQALLTNNFSLVTPYNNSLTPALYTFNYAQGILAFLSNTEVDPDRETAGAAL
jgi:ABC-type glycerol-3-phosphate transport system substrate-binding protein